MADLTYHNFDLSFQRDGDAYRAKADSPEGQAAHTFALPFSDIELENFLLTTRPGARSVRRIDTPDVAAAKRFGGGLFQAVFAGDVQDVWRSSLSAASQQNTRLRVRLRFTDTPELADLPWEYLFSTSLNRFLSLDDEIAIVRFLDMPERTRPVKVALPLRVLVVISDPIDFPPLDVEHEWANIQEALAPLQKKGLVQIDLLHDATLPNLGRQLEASDYHIVHFIGHGTFDRQTQEGLVVLKNEQGRGRLTSGQQIGWLLHNHRSLALAIINACEGARADRTDAFSGTAQSLVQQGIPAVVAMQFEITDGAAKTFSQAFYKAIAEERPVENALYRARMSMFTEEHGLEWATPTLYMRAASGVLFDIDASVKPIKDDEKFVPQEMEPDLDEKRSGETSVTEDEQQDDTQAPQTEQESAAKRVVVSHENRLLWTSATKDRLAFFRMSWDVAISPDGKLLAYSKGGRNITVLDMADGKVLRNLEGSNSFVSVAFSPDSSILAALSRESVFFWDMPSGGSRGSLKVQVGTASVTCTAFSPDWTLVAVGLSDNTIAIRKRIDGTIIKTINSVLGVAAVLAFSPDGTMLAVRSNKGITLFDTATGSRIKDLLKADYEVYKPTLSKLTSDLAPGKIAFSPDGKYLAYLLRKDAVLLDVAQDDAERPRSDTVKNDHIDIAWTLAFSPDGHLFASGGGSSNLKIMPLPPVKERNVGYARITISFHPQKIRAIAFSPDSRKVAVLFENGSVQLRELGAENGGQGQ